MNRQAPATPLALRRVDPRYAALRQTLLAAGAATVQVQRLAAGTRYLRCPMLADGVPGRAYIGLAPLLDYWLGAATIPVDSVDRAALLALAQDYVATGGVPLAIHGVVWQMPDAVLDGGAAVLDGGAVEHDSGAPGWLYALPSNHPVMLVSVLPAAFTTGLPANDVSTLPIALHFSLGTTRLRAAELATLEAGDVVRIDGTPSIATAAAHHLGYFKLEGTVVTMLAEDDVAPGALPADQIDQIDQIDQADQTERTEPADSADPAYPADPAASTGQPDRLDPLRSNVGLDQLPVRVDFIVARRDLALRDIARLRAGSTLTLGHADRVAVTLSVAGRTIGTGELVQLGDAYGVELQRLTLAPAAAPAPDSSAAPGMEADDVAKGDGYAEADADPDADARDNADADAYPDLDLDADSNRTGARR